MELAAEEEAVDAGMFMMQLVVNGKLTREVEGDADVGKRPMRSKMERKR